MADEPSLLIVLCSEDPARRGVWSRELTAIGNVVEMRTGLHREASADAPSVLLVIDGASELLPDAAMLAEWLRAGRLAVVQIGPGCETAALPPPEVVLPPDATPREVALACELVGRILQLRLEKRHATAARERLHELAYRDPLTGVLNRRGWEDALSRNFATSKEGVGCCLAMIDLDHFKRINDQFGHAAGDTVLTRCAQILAAELRPADVVARLGGDEFAVLIADVDRASASAVVDRLLNALRIGLADAAPLAVTVSMGFRHLDGSQGTLDGPACLKIVDEALHEAKRQGRDRAVSAGR